MEGKKQGVDEEQGTDEKQEVFVYQRNKKLLIEQLHLQIPESKSSGTQAYKEFCDLYPNTQLCVELSKPEEGIQYVKVVPCETLYIHRIVRVLRIGGGLLGRLYLCYHFARSPEFKLVLDPAT